MFRSSDARLSFSVLSAARVHSVHSVESASGGETGTVDGRTGAANASTFALASTTSLGETVLPPFGAGWLPPFVGATTLSAGTGTVGPFPSAWHPQPPHWRARRAVRRTTFRSASDALDVDGSMGSRPLRPVALAPSPADVHRQMGHTSHRALCNSKDAHRRRWQAYSPCQTRTKRWLRHQCHPAT